VTVKDLEDFLSYVPPDTSVLVEIEGVEACIASGDINYVPFNFVTERGALSSITDDPIVKSVTLKVSYGPAKV